MSMLLVHELYEARDRIHLLKQNLENARQEELDAYRPFIDEQIELLTEALEQAHIPERYRVAVVGHFNVGKSAFVNKLLGKRLAGVNTARETAAISIFRYDTQTRAEVELISQEEWKNLREDHKENPKLDEVKRYDGFIRFNERPLSKDKNNKEIPREHIDLNALEKQWIQPGGKIHTINAENWNTRDGEKLFLNQIKKFTSSQSPIHYLVNKITIYAPIPILRDQIEIIDTPGLEDTERFRVQLTEELVKNVDAILFLTDCNAPYGQNEKEFIIRQIRQRQIKHLQLIATKCDITFENAVKDANDNDDDPPVFPEWRMAQAKNIRDESKSTLDELLQSNKLSDEDGYYYMEQLDDVPVHMVSTKYHDDGDVDKGGIDAVQNGLYRILSTSNRFEHARSVLTERLNIVLQRLKQAFGERLNTLASEFDPAKVREEIASIRSALIRQMDDFDDKSLKGLERLKEGQESLFNNLPLHLDVISLQAKEVIVDIERDDLDIHFIRRRNGRWAYLSGLQTQIADRIFPRVETVLKELDNHLNIFMSQTEYLLAMLQADIERIESDHKLSGLEGIDIASAQTPFFDALCQKFKKFNDHKDGIISKLDMFVSEEAQERLENARQKVSEIRGKGTVKKQQEQVKRFYDEITIILVKALRQHLENRIREFAESIKISSKSVGPKIRDASEALIQQRLKAIESTLQIAAEGQKEQVTAYLTTMLAFLRNFPANPEAISFGSAISKKDQKINLNGSKMRDGKDEIDIPGGMLQEQHYEINENATGYTYERIFRPYMDDAETITIEDPYIRLPHQVDNFARFCALALRCEKVSKINLLTGKQNGEDSDDADSRLETLKRDLNARGIDFTWERGHSLHDREVRFDNGWIVKIGRGLDIYNKPESWVSMEAADLCLRRCRQTKVDIFRSAEAVN